MTRCDVATWWMSLLLFALGVGLILAAALSFEAGV